VAIGSIEAEAAHHAAAEAKRLSRAQYTRSAAAHQWQSEPSAAASALETELGRFEAEKLSATRRRRIISISRSSRARPGPHSGLPASANKIGRVARMKQWPRTMKRRRMSQRFEPINAQVEEEETDPIRSDSLLSSRRRSPRLCVGSCVTVRVSLVQLYTKHRSSIQVAPDAMHSATRISGRRRRSMTPCARWRINGATATLAKIQCVEVRGSTPCRE
jgi:hypothetical protein